MGKGSGSTRTSTSGSPRGLNESSQNNNRIDLAEVYRSSGMLEMDRAKMPRITEADFVDEDDYYRLTKPMDLDVDINDTEDFWNRGLTGAESGQKLRLAKQEIVNRIKSFSGEELRPSDVEWNKDLNEFVAYHHPKKPGDTGKSYWKLDNIKQKVRFRREKRTGYLSAADKYGKDLYSHYASHDYTVKVKNTGVKEY